MNKKLFIVGLVLISFIYLFVRFYHLDSLLGFRYDQGLHLLETKEMFDSKKISLLGPMVTSRSFMGRHVFIGANYYYVLGTIGVISRWDPLSITTIFIVLEYLCYLAFVLFIGRKYGFVFALMVFVFIAFSPYLIIHSRFFWNTHFLIPLSIFILLSFFKYLENKRFRYLFATAYFWGFALACHYGAIAWAFLFLPVILKFKIQLNIEKYCLLLAGLVLGNMPFFVFELRHGFYNTKTLIYIFINSADSKQLSVQHFVYPFFIFVTFILISFLAKIKRKYLGHFILITVFGILLTAQIRFIDSFYPLDIIKGWNYPEQRQITDLIVKDGCPQNFNIAATIQGDTRFYDLRYLLNLKNCNPLPVEAYPQAQRLFLVAPLSRPVDSETVWEVNALKPFIINQKIPINNQIIFYELERADNKSTDLSKD